MRKKNILPIVYILIALAFGISACQQTSPSLQEPTPTLQQPTPTLHIDTPRPPGLHFDTIDSTDFSTGYIVFESSEPGMMVFTNPEDAGNLQLNTPDDIEPKLKLEELDYSKYFALMVLEGEKPTTGYSVKIASMMRSGKVVTVYADFLEFPENMERADVVTYPYHLVAIEKTGEWAETITFNLVVDQVLVASISHFIPQGLLYQNYPN
jgi:PrcB C-terminal